MFEAAFCQSTQLPLTDSQLIQSALQGNESSFAKLLDKYWDGVHSFLSEKLNNSEDTEDLTIIAFSRAFANLSQYNQEYAFSTWLYAIASHAWIDFTRKKGHKFVSLDELFMGEEDDSLGIQVEDSAPNPEQGVINGQRRKMIQSWVKKLKPNYRELVEMYYLKEMSYEEIAEQTQLPIGTIKTKLFRARLLLERMFDDHHEI